MQETRKITLVIEPDGPAVVDLCKSALLDRFKGEDFKSAVGGSARGAQGAVTIP